jgi:hypothetical protein
MVMHPWDRLHRPSPGQRLSEPRDLEAQLWSRDREFREPHRVLSEGKALPERKVRNTRNTVEARPNAPLLKRIMRSPFALVPERQKRQTFRGVVPWADLHRERLVSFGTLLAEAHPRVEFNSPIATLAADRRIQRDVRPGIQSWLASGHPARPVPPDDEHGGR